MGDVHVTGRRIVATIIDGILFSIVYALFGQGFTTAAPAHHSGLDFTSLRTGAGLGWVLLVIVYYTVMEGLVGRTVGKMVTGIRVVSESTGRPPGLGAALLRTILRVIDGIFGYLLGFIVVLASSRRRRLGDMAARTLVVRS